MSKPVEVVINVYASSDAKKAPLHKIYPIPGATCVMAKKRNHTTKLEPEALEKLQQLLLAEAKKGKKRPLEIVALEYLAETVYRARRYAHVMASGENKAKTNFVVYANLVIS